MQNTWWIFTENFDELCFLFYVGSVHEENEPFKCQFCIENFNNKQFEG